ncbi:MAG: zinc ribbon domain-containing protein, partial [Burkholderiales bacterium]
MYPIKCGFCRHGNPTGSRYCNACGAPLSAEPCPDCGA